MTETLHLELIGPGEAISLQTTPPGPPPSLAKSGGDDDQDFYDEEVDTSQWFDPRKLSKKGPLKPWHEWRLTKDFEVGRPLGRGKFGHVYLARTVREKFYCALKVIHCKQVEEGKMEQEVIRETEIHIDLDHPNIIKMFGYFREDDKIIYALEYAPGGDVYFELLCHPGGRFSDEKAATYIFQVINALDYLHDNNIIHRDLNPGNLLIGFRGEIKMADFGWSIQTSGPRMKCGTLDYLPPEMVTGKEYDEKVDLWSLGVLTYEFLVGKAPFQSSEINNREDTCQKIASGNIDFPEFIQQDAKNFIGQILKVNPHERQSLSDSMEHRWIQKNKILEKKEVFLPLFEEMTHLLPKIKLRYEEATVMNRKQESLLESF